MQERDGYAKQLAALRDDIAALSRQLAERDEDGHASADRIAQLHRQVQEWQVAAEETRRALAERESRFDDAAAEHAAEMRTVKQALAQASLVWESSCVRVLHVCCVAMFLRVSCNTGDTILPLKHEKCSSRRSAHTGLHTWLKVFGAVSN